MVEITLAGRLVPGGNAPVYHTKPSGLRSGYRGAYAGSREAGETSFEIVFRNGVESERIWFTTGSEVVIQEGKTVLFRGVVAGLDVPKIGRVVEVDCVESGAQLMQVQSGMVRLGGLVNPTNYVWEHEASGLGVGEDDKGDAISIQAKLLKPGDAYASPFDAARRGFSKRELFDTFGYRSDSNGARRTMLMYEQTVSDLCARLMAVTVQDDSGPELTARDVNMAAGRKQPQMFLPLDDEDGKRLLPEWDEANRRYRTWGLFTRNLTPQAERGSNYATLYWREIDMDGLPAVELYQFVNHSIARKLGQVRMDRAFFGYESEFESLPHEIDSPFHRYGNPVHSFEGTLRHGPFPVIKTGGENFDDTQIAWFWIGGYAIYNPAEDKTYYYRRASVYSVDLQQLLDERGEKIAFQRVDLEAFSINPTSTHDWVAAQGDSYMLTSSAQPIVGWTSQRTGGRYEIGRETGFLGPVFWIGDLYLSEIACEFEGTTVADILHNLGLVTGSEWWVNSDGKLMFRKSDRTIADSVVHAKQLIDDRRSLRLTETGQADDISGIPLSDVYAAALRDENKRTIIDTANRRVIEVIPDTVAVTIGSELVLDGERCGKVVALEWDDPVLKLECEPV